MKFANISGRACIIHDGRALDIERASRGEIAPDPMMYTRLAQHPRLESLLAAASPGDFREFDVAHLGPPVPRPGNIIAVALNYHDHIEETGRQQSEEPVVFSKLTSSVCGPYDPIEVAADWTRVDYEAEVVVVIGARLGDAKTDAVWSAVAGVTVGQDISDRAEQNREPLRQFSFAKSYKTFTPIGPYLSTVDDFGDPDRIELFSRVDGMEVQRATTAQLIRSVPELVSWISRRVVLVPGDLILTGTPGGVGSRRTPPLFLSPGMVLETGIPLVGIMRNLVRERPSATDRSASVQEEELSA
ncbi:MULTISPECIES: fumarylacetoacetate hydrolase family protein [unclassified Pseudofrankia]|uniref:fumarylacetoacetate hydrolase family protein n=1 Tax=unclassified Pseudofrankia TaxID=2994372 RepID=UPI0008DB07A7|nr:MULTISPECIES: fumarylacetoacetate hydrolase family protein [unclassified Pseudofrankia]MDT3447006.1 fumarylacetoacetate hydrolase family protein [Pseudofrankia sp. BMG5.37]OHV54571.1 hypothetical protein BCD48_44505 [Pseudofrankia sp. BMG5.36]